MVIFKKAETEEELSEAYKLRFEVYCRERNFLPYKEYPFQYEIDEFDPYSIHFIAMIDSQPIGTSRLILNNPGGFPIEKHYNLDISEIGMNKEMATEISRLAVIKKRVRILGYGKAKITWGLFKVMYQEAQNHGIKHLYAAMEISLWRLLSKCHIRFSQIGLSKEYYGGLCAPFVADMKDIENNLFLNNEPLAKV